jgi:catechol 2,3-dioxygenase-like lactoylglutathione lyase family enzyme
MVEPPEVKLLSLFVRDLEIASRRYAAVLGVEPATDCGRAPNPHPFSDTGPVVFQLGPIALALYQAAPDRGTHPGDVGIGLSVGGAVSEIATRAGKHGGTVFFGPSQLPADGREMAVFVLPDRHFFELLAE